MTVLVCNKAGNTFIEPDLFQWWIQNFHGGERGTNLLFDQIFPKTA